MNITHLQTGDIIIIHLKRDANAETINSIGSAINKSCSHTVFVTTPNSEMEIVRPAIREETKILLVEGTAKQDTIKPVDREKIHQAALRLERIGQQDYLTAYQGLLATYEAFNSRPETENPPETSDGYHTLRFFNLISAFLAGGIPGIGRYIRFTHGTFGEDNSFATARQNDDATTPVVLIRPSELYSEYTDTLRERGSSPQISLDVLRSNLRRLPCWATHPQNKPHRIHWGDGEGQKQVWILRYDRMSEDMREVFKDHFLEPEAADNTESKNRHLDFSHLQAGIASTVASATNRSLDEVMRSMSHIISRAHSATPGGTPLPTPAESAPLPTPEPLPELPPLGHDLTYPADAEAIRQLGIAYNQALSYCEEGKEQETITRLRQAARRHGLTDLDAFDSFRIWIRVTNNASEACDRVEYSMKAANVAQVSAPATQPQPKSSQNGSTADIDGQ